MGKNTKPGKAAKKASRSTKPAFKALPDDIIIPVMGPTGVGKSTFINHLAKNSVKVGHDLKSCTADLQPVVITSSQHPQLGSQRLVIVDTPGFDDTYVSDSEILRRIASWLVIAYNNEMKLGGVIYLHDISLSRTLSTTRKNLEVFRKLCGDDAFRSVILGTTKWGDVFKEDGDMRTQQLRENYWRYMVDHGSKVFKFEDSSKSAWTMVDSIVDLNRSRAESRAKILQMQRELVDALELMPDTEAGQKLRNDLDQVLKKFKEDRKALKKDESNRLELHNEIAQVRERMKLMQVPVSQRVLDFFSLGIDKILDAFALSPPAPESSITRLAIDCDRLVLLFGENREVKDMLLKLLSAQEVDVGNDQNAPTQEIKCWSVGTNEETSIIIDTPDFHSSSNPERAVQKTRTWLETSCREDMELGTVYLKLSGLDLSSSPESPPTRSHDIYGSSSGIGAVSLQANNLPIPAAFLRVTPRPDESTLSLNQSLSNNKLVSNAPSDLSSTRQLPSNPPVISLTGARPFTPSSDTQTDTSFPHSSASISPPKKDVRPSLITQTSNDTSLPAAPKQGPPPTIVLVDEGTTSAAPVPWNPLPTKESVPTASISPAEKDVRPFSITQTFNDTGLPAAPKQGPPQTIVLVDEGITSAAPVAGNLLPTKQQVPTASISPAEKDVRPFSITQTPNDTSLPATPKQGPPPTIVLGDEGITSATTVAGHPLPTKQPVSPRHISPRSKGSQPTPSPTPSPAGIAGSSLSAMELFQGLPSADTILFATLTTRPKTQTSEEALEAVNVPYYYASDGKVVEFQNTPEAAQAMLHLSLNKTLPVGVLLDALISLDEEESSKGGKFKRRLGRFGRLFL